MTSLQKLNPDTYQTLIQQMITNKQKFNINAYGYPKSGKSDLLQKIVECFKKQKNLISYHYKLKIHNDKIQFISYLDIMKYKLHAKTNQSITNVVKQSHQQEYVMLLEQDVLFILDDVDQLSDDQQQLVQFMNRVVCTSIKPLFLQNNKIIQLQLIIDNGRLNQNRNQYFQMMSRRINHPTHFNKTQQIVLIISYILSYLPERLDSLFFGNENNIQSKRKYKVKFNKAKSSISEQRLIRQLIEFNNNHRFFNEQIVDIRDELQVLYGELLNKRGRNIQSRVDKELFELFCQQTQLNFEIGL